VALARPHLVDPYFTMRAAAWYGVKTQHVPKQYLSGMAQAEREAARARERQTELQRKANPRHGK
jgi:anthraniloyl-CoA monooxygenase